MLIDDAGAEDLLYTAWCGRLIPKAFSRTLPPLVAEAAQSTDKGATAWRLTSSRLWYVCSLVHKLHYHCYQQQMLCGRTSAA